MLVTTIEVMHSEKEVIPSCVWLYGRDQSFGIRRQLFLLGKSDLKFFERLSERELNVILSSPKFKGYSAQHLIERRTKIVQNISDNGMEFIRQALRDLEFPDFLCAVGIGFGHHLIRIRTVEFGDLCIEFVDVGRGPLDFRECRYQGSWFHLTGL